MIERVMVFMYGKTIEKLDYMNYSDIISKDVARIFLFMVINILTIIFSHSYLMYVAISCLVYYVIKFFLLFIIYASFSKGTVGNGNKNSDEKNIRNSYKLMGLEYNTDIETVKKKYRELSKLYHPDKYSNDTVEKQEIAKRNFQRLNTAYNNIKSIK